ncbi:hypothetical protein [Streptomyces sp. NRRL S-455]|uniref:hypothetical protein n=1 Tax=Streptomyces sp. NRRL S-455 TaxID=1463908 RepID=UPI00131A5C0C|nr:hypothetical protein [Streptomyces sp. NRRL S-455]
MSRTQAATYGLLVPAALALAMSADTSYRFMETALQISDETERMILCGVAEAAIVALTVYAWATRTKGPAYLAYAAVLVQGIPAFTVSGSVGGPVRVVLGPVLLAVLLHLLLGLELRMSGAKSDSLLASALRELKERLTAFLGIGRRGADSAAIARSRAADKAVDLADRLAAAQPGKRKHTRLVGRLAKQIDAARHGLNETEAAQAEAAIVARVVRRKSVKALANISTRHDWSLSLVPAPAVPVGDTGQSDVPTFVSPEAAVPRDTADVPAPVVPQRDMSRVPQDVVPAPEPVVPAAVSRPRAAVPATMSRPRPTVRISLDKTPEEISAERDMSRSAGQASVDVPEDVRDNLTGIVRFLMETGHDKAEVRAIVPTLPGHGDTKPGGPKSESLRKAIQRTFPKE